MAWQAWQLTLLGCQERGALALAQWLKLLGCQEHGAVHMEWQARQLTTLGCQEQGAVALAWQGQGAVKEMDLLLLVALALCCQPFAYRLVAVAP